MLSAVAAPRLAIVAAEAVGDPESTRRVYTTIVIFVAIGVAMIVLAVWLFRRTRPEPQLLAPLEVMDSRRWRRSEPAQRRRELDDKRPPGARPLRRAAEPPEVDTEFAAPPPVRSFDDLADRPEPVADADGAAEAEGPAAAVDPTPIGSDAIDVLLDDETQESAGADDQVTLDPAPADETAEPRRSEDSSA